MIICVCMRYGSSRLPGKALLDLGGLTSLALLAGQLRASRYPTVICCPTGEEDDAIAQHAEALGCQVFRGPLEGVVERMLLAAQKYRADAFIRVTGDDLFIDPARLDRLAEAHRAAGADFSFTDLPKGTESVVMKTDFARRLVEDAREDSSEYWDKRRGPVWAEARLHFEPLSPVVADDRTFALELDTPEDAEVIREALARLGAEGRAQPYTVEDLAALHAERPFPKSKPPVDEDLLARFKRQPSRA
jgi:spore coat polysaccharide biosynthesis protein SpsF (cytidylyltransferase family)